MNKEQEEKIISEVNVQEQYKQFLLTQKNEKNKEVSQITAKTEEIYMDVAKTPIFLKKTKKKLIKNFRLIENCVN